MKQIIAFLIAIMLLCTISLAFSDTSDHALQAYIEEAANTGIITGYPDNTFRPDVPVNRAEFVAMMNRALGIAGCAVSPFTDVPASEWYAQEVEKALSVGYINGKSADSFAPLATITRGETAVILSRLAKEDCSSICAYTDFIDTLPDWLSQGMTFAWNTGVFDMFVDRTDAFLPYEPMTRAQCAAVITAFLNSLEAQPVYMTVCSESDEKLDRNSENILYLNIFGKDLFASLCKDGKNQIFTDSSEAENAFKRLETIINLKTSAKNIRITGKYLLELTPDLAYIGLSVTPTTDSTASVSVTVTPKKTSYDMADGFDTVQKTYTDRVCRIDSAANLVCTETNGIYTVTWNRDERIIAYSIIVTDASGTHAKNFTDDIVIKGDMLTADVTEAIKALGSKDGTVIVIGYTNDTEVETRPNMTVFS